MKSIAIILILLTVLFQAYATQMPPRSDVFIENGVEVRLVGAWGDKNILAHYFDQKKMTPPKEIIDKEEFRSHVDYWTVFQNKLMLKKIMVEDYETAQRKKGHFGLLGYDEVKPFELSNIFESELTDNGVHANWFTGPILVEGNDSDDNPKEYRIMYFRNGLFIEQHSWSNSEFFSALEEIRPEIQTNLTADAEFIKEYLLYGSKKEMHNQSIEAIVTTPVD